MGNGHVGSYQGQAHHEYGDTYRISHKGNVVIEHNGSGTEETVRNGHVVGREPLQYQKDEYRAPVRNYYPRNNDYNRPVVVFHNDYNNDYNNRPSYNPAPVYTSGRNLITSRQELINMVNDEVGYNVEHINYGDTARISERGNLVIEHNSRGTEDVIAHGQVVSRDEPLHHTGGYGNYSYQSRGGISFQLNLN